MALESPARLRRAKDDVKSIVCVTGRLRLSYRSRRTFPGRPHAGSQSDFERSKLLGATPSIASRVVSFFKTKPPTNLITTEDWEPWRERPLNGAWDESFAPRRGRSRLGSFPVNRNRCSGRHKTPPQFRSAPPSASRYGCYASRAFMPLFGDAAGDAHAVNHCLATGAEAVRGVCPLSRPLPRPPSRPLATVIQQRLPGREEVV
jgi:hypothetical protein